MVKDIAAHEMYRNEEKEKKSAFELVETAGGYGWELDNGDQDSEAPSDYNK